MHQVLLAPATVGWNENHYEYVQCPDEFVIQFVFRKTDARFSVLKTRSRAFSVKCVKASDCASLGLCHCSQLWTQ